MKKSEISFLNVLFCLIVIFIHICSEPVTGLTRASFPHIVVFTAWKLSSFVVQGFILLAGMKLCLSKKDISFGKYIKSRFMKIILPYLVAVFAYYLCFCMCNYYSFSIYDMLMYALRGNLAAHFYFVIIIAQFYLLKNVWKKLVDNVPAVWSVVISAVVSLIGTLYFRRFFGMYNDRVLTTYLIYWVAGCYIGKNYQRFMDFLSSKKTAVILLYILFAALEVTVAYCLQIPSYLVVALNILFCLSSILMCMVLAGLCSDFFMKSRVLSMVNASSYYIYLWHMLVLIIADRLLNQTGISALDIRFFIRGAVVYFVSIFLCGVYVKIKERIRG